MELLLLVGIAIALGVAANLWGVDSRDGLDTRVRPRRWFIEPLNKGDGVDSGRSPRPGPDGHERTAVSPLRPAPSR